MRRMTTLDDVLAWLGRTDVYLLDQVMRGRLRPPMRVLDAGCGDGRNVELLLRGGFEVHAIDSDAGAVAKLRDHAADVAPHLPASNFGVGAVEALPYADASFDAVLCVAVLHFARDRAHLDAMAGELARVLRPGGLLFARLATTITVEGRTLPLGGGRHRLGDGSERFLTGEADLAAVARGIGELADPLKTVNVENLRAMTTWVVRKRATPRT
jgi:SAM-dependent methyltransferase